MDLLDLLRTMARRWYVVVPVLALTAGGVYWTAVTTEPTYEADGMFIMTPPGSVPGELADGSIVIPDPAAAIRSVPALAALMGSDAVRAELTPGSDANYEVSPLSGTDLVDVRASGPARDELGPLLEQVLEAIERRVGEVVQVVPPPSAPRQLPSGPDGDPWFTVSTVVSVPSLAASSPNAPEPSFNGRLLSEMMADPAARREVLGQELDGTFEFSQDRRNPGPFLQLTATSTGPDATLEVFDRALKDASERLDALQASQGVAPASRMVLHPIRRPAGAKLVSGARSRPLFTIAGLGGLAALGLALLVEAMAAQRRRDEPAMGTIQTDEATVSPDRLRADRVDPPVSRRGGDPPAASARRGPTTPAESRPATPDVGASRSGDVSPERAAPRAGTTAVVVPWSTDRGHGGSWSAVEAPAVVDRPRDARGSTE